MSEASSRVNVRNYQAGDAASVSELIRTTMRASNASDYPLERLRPLIDYFSPAKVDALSRERTCLVAERDGRVIGTAALDAHEIVTFFVLPEEQGRGAGSALLAALEAAARAEGREQLEVKSSLTAVGFYERHGYRGTGETFDGTSGPQVPMHKLLA